MKLLPVALNVEGKRCLIVGGGPVARRKAESLLECGAQVCVVAPQLAAEFEPMLGNLEYRARPFQSGDCEGSELVFACTDSREINSEVVAEARLLKIWSNIADDSTGSDFHMAAAVRRGDICAGITTGGGSPALARHLKARVQECIGPEYAELLELMSAHRATLQETPATQKERAALWHAILESETLELLIEGRRDAAKIAVDALIAQHSVPQYPTPTLTPDT